jgi:hypothetical protein
MKPGAVPCAESLIAHALRFFEPIRDAVHDMNDWRDASTTSLLHAAQSTKYMGSLLPGFSIGGSTANDNQMRY